MNSYKIEKKFCGLARISKVQKKGLIFFQGQQFLKKNHGPQRTGLEATASFSNLLLSFY